jgi:hypothetical protein
MKEVYGESIKVTRVNNIFNDTQSNLKQSKDKLILTSKSTENISLNTY